MRLRQRIICLEARLSLPAIYPIYAVFSNEHVLEYMHMNDGSRLVGPDAHTAYGNLPTSFPLKVYAGFDPDECFNAH